MLAWAVPGPSVDTQSQHKLLHLCYRHGICCATILGWQTKTVHNDSIMGKFRMVAMNLGVYSQLSYLESGRSQKCTQYENVSHAKDVVVQSLFFDGIYI